MSRLAGLALALILAAAACSDEGSPGDASREPAPEEAPATTTAPATASPATGAVIPEELQEAVRLWDTDWSSRTIDLAELRLGLPGPDPRDRITPIDDPAFVSAAEAAGWLADREPGMLLVLGDEARFYPLQILTLHEIVNDEVAGAPVAVTYCPLCNTGIAFDRRLDGATLRLGVSGLLRNNDLVMWEDETDSLFQQITGEGIVGALAGSRLTVIPSTLVRFADVRAQYPEVAVLSRDTEHALPYGLNPYSGYSSRPGPLVSEGAIDPRYPALSRVVGVTVTGESKAYPFEVVEAQGAVDDAVGGVPIAVWWGAADTADALDTPRIADGRGIGVGVAYDRRVDGQELTFERTGDTTFRDRETGSTWTILGTATDGPLAGARLEPVPHRNEFWFAWAGFFPEAAVYEG